MRKSKKGKHPKALEKIVRSRRFNLTAKNYYYAFYKSDIESPDKGLGRKHASRKNEKTQKIIMLQSCEPQ